LDFLYLNAKNMNLLKLFSKGLEQKNLIIKTFCLCFFLDNLAYSKFKLKKKLDSDFFSSLNLKIV
jgi:hypothetical protein